MLSPLLGLRLTEISHIVKKHLGESMSPDMNSQTSVKNIWNRFGGLV